MPFAVGAGKGWWWLRFATFNKQKTLFSLEVGQKVLKLTLNDRIF